MNEPVFSHAEPVLQVSNVTETVRYWQEVLGFPSQWTWGQPATHGGVSWHGAFVQFSQNPEAAAKSHGEYIWIRITEIETLYALHTERKANIVVPLAGQSYGFDEYVVKDLNGYYIVFAAPSSKTKKSENLPESIKIIPRVPTSAEYRRLSHSVGWHSSLPNKSLQKQLDIMLFGAVAETSDGEVVGCALIFGDGFHFFYIKDVMVHPDWQGKRIGTAVMLEISRWLEENATDKATAMLFTGENLKPFYQQFHFAPAYGMTRTFHKEEKP